MRGGGLNKPPIRLGEDARLGARLDQYSQLVEPLRRTHLQNIVRGKPRLGREHRLDLRGKEVDPADDQHVVAPPLDPLDPPHRAAFAGEEAGEIAGPVAEERHRFAGRRGENRFALLPVGKHRPGIGIDHGVAVMIVAPKSTISRTRRSVKPPLAGTTAAPSRSAPQWKPGPPDVVGPGLHLGALSGLVREG
jgi:hypothetical protein